MALTFAECVTGNSEHDDSTSRWTRLVLLSFVHNVNDPLNRQTVKLDRGGSITHHALNRELTISIANLDQLTRKKRSAGESAALQQITSEVLVMGSGVWPKVCSVHPHFVLMY
ncbi:hypothetical protein CEXT_110201 [Caerostris extrusa]|uniref:Uncharacterized protein n=1 Tax=Caerostris extrusa TaxID=172846 RepID=A0AAV4YFI5_CAEEX|nr:hypothetical protein CEXT_110201 [Caerostris extrusa]